MALLTVQEVAQTGFDHTTYLQQAVLSGDQFPNDDRTYLVIANGAAGATCNVTIAATRATVDKPGFGTLDVDDITMAVPNNQTWFVRVPLASHGDAAGRVTITYDQITNVDVGAFRLAKG